jgi:hypothetical protein
MKKGERIDLTGKVFGRWTVICYYNSKNRQSYYLCKCICGEKKIVYGQSLTRHLSKSCGCIQKETPANLQHGLCHTRFHRIWAGIKNRCLNSNQINFTRYGGKGIKICDKWKDFLSFRDDMWLNYQFHVKKYGEKNTQIDRIDNQKNYSLSNCRWVTLKEQANNKQKKYGRKIS